ncbi:hypothetical protein [Azotobacter chroococcum]|uniref:hypothetical protein n=1 Tax=Azotobacter chroococcum TaxID=353 RepID=UPI0010AEC7DE|nr:hypothetical protein [Azotobacter chroococcum]TKD43852.1 hypothetical protein FCG41_07735 [Azotobacter chroococcum]
MSQKKLDTRHENCRKSLDITDYELDTFVREIADRLILEVNKLSNSGVGSRELNVRLLGRLEKYMVDNYINGSLHQEAASFVNEQEFKEAVERGNELQREVFSSPEIIVRQEPMPESGLLCLSHPDHSNLFGYPIWQFDECRNQKKVVQQILCGLSDLPPWAQWHFFHTGLPALYDLSPLQVLGLEHDTKVYDQGSINKLKKLQSQCGDLNKYVISVAYGYGLEG